MFTRIVLLQKCPSNRHDVSAEIVLHESTHRYIPGPTPLKRMLCFMLNTLQVYVAGPRRP
jgi:hypothetical protein